MERGRWVWSLGAAVFLAATATRAEEPAATDRAQLANLLREGASAAQSKSWTACIEAFARAAAIQQDPITLGELGLCEDAAGRYADAHKHLRRARAGLTPAAPRWKAYQAAFGRATEHVAIVFVTVQPSNARVLLDGLPLGPGDGLAVAVAPGKHTISAHLAGYESASDTRDVNAQDMPNVDLVLKPAPKEEPSAPIAAGSSTQPPPSATVVAPSVMPVPVDPTCAAPPPRPTTSSPWYAPSWSPRGVFVGLTYVSAATLVVSGATAIGFEIDRASFESDLPRFTSSDPTHCHALGSVQSRLCNELGDRFERRNVARAVVIGAAISTLATGGIAALLIGVDRGPPQPSIAPLVSTNAGGIIVTGAW